MSNIIKFTNAEGGVFAHVDGPSGVTHGICLNNFVGDLSDPFNTSGRFFQALIEQVKSGAATDEAEEPMPAVFYADMLAMEVSFTGAVSSTFSVDLDDEQWIVRADRVGCGRCGGAE